MLQSCGELFCSDLVLYLFDLRMGETKNPHFNDFVISGPSTNFIDRFCYCRVRERGGQRARPRKDSRYCSCGIAARNKTMIFFVARKNENATKQHNGVLSQRKYSAQKPRFFAMLYTITNQHMTKIRLRGWRVAGRLREQGIWTFPLFRKFPWFASCAAANTSQHEPARATTSRHKPARPKTSKDEPTQASWQRVKASLVKRPRLSLPKLTQSLLKGLAPADCNCQNSHRTAFQTPNRCFPQSPKSAAPSPPASIVDTSRKHVPQPWSPRGPGLTRSGILPCLEPPSFQTHRVFPCWEHRPPSQKDCPTCLPLDLGGKPTKRRPIKF